MEMEPSKKPMDKKKKILLAVLIPAAVAAIACAILIPLFVIGKEPEEVSYPDFCTMVEKKEVEKVTYTAGSPKMKFEKIGSDVEYETDNPKVEGFKEKMLLAGVEFEEIIPSSFWSTFFSRAADLSAICSAFVPGISYDARKGICRGSGGTTGHYL